MSPARKQELEARAQQLSGYPHLPETIFYALQQVEREVWRQAADKWDALLERDDVSTIDQVYKYRDWCRDQGGA